MDEIARLKVFWRLPLHRNHLRSAIELSGLAPGAIEQHGKVMLKANHAYQPLEGKIRRFRARDQKTMHDPRHLVGILLITLDVLAHMPQSELEANPERISMLKQLRSELRSLCELIPEKEFPGHRHNDMKAVARSNSLLDNVVALLAHQFSLKPDEFVEIGSYFFPKLNLKDLPEKPLTAQFNMYRFAAKEGEIVKSFTEIESPTQTVAACVFTNIFISGKRHIPRKTQGLIVPTRNAIYFVGAISDGAGLKFMACERLDSAPKTHQGLITTFDDKSVIVSARFMMVPTKAKSHDKAKSGVYPQAELKEETKGFIDQLRNRVYFKLEKRLTLKNETVMQKDLKAKTHEAFKRGFKAQILDEEGNEFNSAANEDYPWNSALTIWTDREKP
jgi:hypothetical protein